MTGPEAFAVAEHLGAGGLQAGRVHLRTLRDGGDAALDEAVVLAWRGPHSATGEDVIEFHVHGGRAVVDGVLSAALATGLCAPAPPGEFTRRAVAAGKLDLLQAEAIADLTDAETDGQRRFAIAALRGDGSRQVASWREEVTGIMALLEAAIDFADEGDIPPDVAAGAVARMAALRTALEVAAGDLARSEIARDGYRVAIIGAPNAGKSSLLNALAGREAAIVSPMPGTTRDVVEVRLVLAGFPVWIADTAGLREATDSIEGEGIRRARVRAEEADLRIGCVDLTSEAEGESGGLAGLLRADDLRVATKADLGARPPEGWLAVSTVTGVGVAELLGQVEARVQAQLADAGPPVLGRARHRALVLEAAAALGRAQGTLAVAVELAAEDLRLAARWLAALVGEVDVEDVLGAIFARFCVGK
jgi:tRNA modification GTPase